MGAIVQAHEDVRPIRQLGLDALFRREQQLFAASVRPEYDLVGAYLPIFRVFPDHGKNQKSAGDGEDGPDPADQAEQAAQGLQRGGARLAQQVVGIHHQAWHLALPQISRVHAAHNALGSVREKGRQAQGSVRGFHLQVIPPPR